MTERRAGYGLSCPGREGPVRGVEARLWRILLPAASQVVVALWRGEKMTAREAQALNLRVYEAMLEGVRALLERGDVPPRGRVAAGMRIRGGRGQEGDDESVR